MRVLLLIAVLGCRTKNVDTLDGTVADDFYSSINEEDQVVEDDTGDSDGENETLEPDDSNDSGDDDPSETDSDGDGLTDSEESENGTDPNDADSDDDGLSDGDELNVGTDPNDSDSDDDGLGDKEETIIGTDPNDADSDDDGVSDGDELSLGLDPEDADSDDDGVNDGDEIANGTDPDDDGLSGDTGDFWDWGDESNSDCTDCNLSDFVGFYSVELQFLRINNNAVVCSSVETIYVPLTGEVAFSTSCTTSTGASFDFDIDTYATFASDYAGPGGACLGGTTDVTLPNGSVVSNQMGPDDCYGLITTLADVNQFFPYYDLYLGSYFDIQTPTGPIQYGIILTGTLQ